MSEGNLPNQWIEVEFAEVVDKIVGGGTPSKAVPSYFQGSIPWMTVKDMNKFVLNDTVDHISEEAVRNSATNIIPAGTPIIATRMSLGKLVRANFDSAINQDLKAIFVNLAVNKIYFEYWYRSIAHKIQEMGTGTTVKGIRLEDIKKLNFALSSQAEQQKIAQKLDELLAQVDALKARLGAIPKILKRFRQSVLAAAVSGKLTAGAVAPGFVGDICEKAFDGPFGSKLKTSDYADAGIRVARLENIGHLFFDNTKQTFIAHEKYETLKNNTLKPGDVLFSSFVDEEARVCVFKEPGDFINKADCFCLRPNHKKVTSEFLAYTLASVTSYSQIKEQVQGVTRPRINLKILKSLSFNFPLIEEQTEIVRRVEQLFTYADQIEQRVKDAQARVNYLTQSILAKAFRGELTAEWRAQNPELISGENSAAALLKRIKEEREAMTKSKRKA